MNNNSEQLQAGVCGPIGVFDSGFGGLTILKELRQALPDHNFLFLGDNARAPYGSRSFDIVYRFTLEAVNYLFRQGCPLVILACNTASAKALRTIQQNDLPRIAPDRRVLGVIRPTVEAIGQLSKGGKIGVLGTSGTVNSNSYNLEIAKLYPDFKVYGQACPMWVPLIENNEIDSPATGYFVEKYINLLFSQDKDIDTIILACTHYPLLSAAIRNAVKPDVKIVCQGEIVASSLADYLHRHPEMDRRITRGGECRFQTSENSTTFSSLAEIFLEEQVSANHVAIF